MKIQFPGYFGDSEKNKRFLKRLTITAKKKNIDQTASKDYRHSNQSLISRKLVINKMTFLSYIN